MRYLLWPLILLTLLWAAFTFDFASRGPVFMSFRAIVLVCALIPLAALWAIAVVWTVYETWRFRWPLRKIYRTRLHLWVALLVIIGMLVLVRTTHLPMSLRLWMVEDQLRGMVAPHASETYWVARDVDVGGFAFLEVRSYASRGTFFMTRPSVIGPDAGFILSPDHKLPHTCATHLWGDWYFYAN